MLLVVLFALCALSVPVSGKNLGRLAELRTRASWAAGLAIAIQLVIVSVLPEGNSTLHAALHVTTYVLAGYWIVLNRKLPGVWLLAAGGLANFTAIAVNGGVMPASRAALRAAHVSVGHGFSNSAGVVHAKLAFLGDLIPIPAPGGLGNVLSVGDIAITLGVLVLLHGVCRRAAAPQALSPSAGTAG